MNYFKISAVLIISVATMMSIVSCSGKGGDPGEIKPNIQILSADESGYLSIDIDDLSDEVSYYNYEVNGTAVLLMALKDKDGSAHIAFNTCQSCSPSPKAYYLQSGDKLICQNCKFEFTAEQVGLTHGGCNPWPVDGIEFTDNRIMIPVTSIESMASVFENWAGPKE